MSMRDRVGRFFVSRVLVDDNPEMILPVMARCVVVDCKLHFVNDKFEYVALSPDFDIKPPAEIVPEYSVMIEMVDDLPVVTFKRISA